MIRVGFIGLGGMGMYQAKSFHAVTSCQVAGGADPSPEMQARFAQSYPGALVFASYEELLAHPGIDAVVIAVPTGYHQQIAAAALAVRKPVLLEKPMARTVAQCWRLIDDAERPVPLNFNWSVQPLHELLEDCPEVAPRQRINPDGRLIQQQ